MGLAGDVGHVDPIVVPSSDRFTVGIPYRNCCRPGRSHLGIRWGRHFFFDSCEEDRPLVFLVEKKENHIFGLMLCLFFLFFHIPDELIENHTNKKRKTVNKKMDGSYLGWDEIDKDPILKKEFFWVNSSTLHNGRKSGKLRTLPHDAGGKHRYRYLLGDLRELRRKSLFLSSPSSASGIPPPKNDERRFNHLLPGPYVPGPLVWPPPSLSSWKSHLAWAHALEISTTGPDNMERTVLQPIWPEMNPIPVAILATRRILDVADHLPGLHINRSLAAIAYHYLRVLASAGFSASPHLVKQYEESEISNLSPEATSMLYFRPIDFTQCDHGTLLNVILPFLQSHLIYRSCLSHKLHQQGFRAVDLLRLVDRHCELTGRTLGFLVFPDDNKKDDDDDRSMPLRTILNLLSPAMISGWRQSLVLIETITRSDGQMMDFVRLLSTCPVRAPQTDEETMSDDNDDDHDDDGEMIDGGRPTDDILLPDRSLPVEGLFESQPVSFVDPLPPMDFIQLCNLPILQRLSGLRDSVVALTERRLARAIWHTTK